VTEIRIHQTIFNNYPTFRRGIVVAKNIHNHGHSKELEAMLNQAIAQSAQQPIDVKTDMRTLVWNDAHRQFGSNPNKFPPAHIALLLGAPESVEHPDPGEVIYMVPESGEVMCRRWNWRNGHTTRITENTHAIVMNIDGLGEECEATTIITRDRVADMLKKFCQADTITTMLSPGQPSFQFDI